MSWQPEKEIEGFVADLADAFGDDLRSVVLHGSVARDEARRDVSDVNLLVLLDDVSPGALLRGAGLARRWREEEGAVPLLFTPEEWRRAADVFPVEVADMRDHRRVLLGDDPVEPLRISLRHLRLQAEREVRGRLVHLREGMLVAADSPEDLGRLLLSAAPSVATYARAVLRLERRAVPAATPDVVEDVADRLAVDPAPFLEVWKARARPGDLRPTLERTAGVFELLLAIAEHVDTLEDR